MPDSSPSGGQRTPRVPRSRTAAFATALVAGLASAIATLPIGAAPASARPAIQPLPANLEAIRAQEATQLYGSPEIRPMDQRQTALITMGDSEISGEGVGNYIPGTHQDGNWCDRSYDQAVFRVGIPADQRYNVACSGGQPKHLIAGNGEHQWNELNQGDYLSIKARNTRIKLIWVVAGANGPGSIEFGPVASDCALGRVFGECLCFGEHGSDRLPDMAHDAARERPARRLDHAGKLPAGAHRPDAVACHVLAGEDEGRRGNALDARMRIRRAHDRAMQHARQGQVVDEASAAGEEALVLDPAHRLPDHPSSSRSRSSRS